MASDLLPIREVSRISGVNSVTLRAWERRYGLIKPTRTEKGHRLYSERDIETIMLILTWLEKGVSIGKVKPLLIKPQNISSGSLWEQLIINMVTLSVSLNYNKLESEIKKLSSEYPSDLFISAIIKPWLMRLHQLDRADQPIIEQSSQQLLSQLLQQWVNIKSATKYGVISCGVTQPLDSLLLRYELQDIDIQSIELGNQQPQQLSLVSDRLVLDRFIVILGSGLNANWFEQNQEVWPANTIFTGEIGKVYQQSGRLNQPYFYPIKTFLKK